MAGFEVTPYGRFCLTPDGQILNHWPAKPRCHPKPSEGSSLGFRVKAKVF
jgi:hypothetical protein